MMNREEKIEAMVRAIKETEYPDFENYPDSHLRAIAELALCAIDEY